MALTHSFRDHLQIAPASRARIAREHDGVVERSCLLHESLYCCGHTERLAHDIQRLLFCYHRATQPRPLAAEAGGVFSTAGFWPAGFSIVGFWFRGVNFRPQSLQRRIRRLPRLFVTLVPFDVDLTDLQTGQIAGLPLGICITSRDLREA